MDFDTLLTQITELLQRQGRVSYGALRRRFNLDDDYLQDLKDELIGAQRLAVDEGGKILVWIGESARAETENWGNGETEGEKAKGVKGEKEKDFGPRTSDSGLTSAERRQLTVMFCDLVGSTALSAQLDPEELREVVRAYQETCTGVIRRYDGHIAQHLGDGLLVYFGYPAAHEEDAQRAVRAGLEIVAALQHLSAQHEVPSPLVGEDPSRARQQAVNAPLPHGRGSEVPPLQVRIGIHTGLVVIGEIGSSEKREILAMGETPNIAARLQVLAQPDTLVISAATQRLVQGLFACQDRGPQEVKGIPTPISMYQVLGESGVQSRFEAAAQKTVYTTWEDIHWADPSTLEVLTLFLDQVPTTQLLMLLTFRPEFTSPWGNRAHLSQMTLSRLSRAQVHEIVSHVADQALRPSTSSGRTESESDGERLPVRAEPIEARTALPPEVVQQIVAKTDGVPLFVEELTKMVIESEVDVGARRAVPLSLGIPATLHDALMARLDRLSTAKEIAQLGATLGREFSYELLQAVSRLDEGTLQHGLKQLVEAELVYQRGLLPQAHYLFKHALICTQSTAYLYASHKRDGDISSVTNRTWKPTMRECLMPLSVQPGFCKDMLERLPQFSLWENRDTFTSSIES